MTGRRKKDDDKKNEKDREPGEASEQLATKLHAFREAMGTGDGKAEIFRKLPGQTNRSYLGSIGVDDVVNEPHETLKALFGGGDYQITFRNEHGEYLKGGSFQASIEGAPLNVADTRLEELEKRLAERGDGQKWTPADMLLMIKAITPQQPDRAEPLELVAGVLTALSPLIAPFIEAKLEKPEPPADPLEQMNRMAELMVSLKELSSGGDSGSLTETMTKHLAPSLGRLLDGAAGKTPATLQPGQETMTDPPGGKPPQPRWFPMLERMVPQFVAWAGGQKDPELRADFVLDEIPDDYLGPIYQELSRGDEFTDEFVAFIPAAAPHREWFEVFFARILAQIRPLDAGEVEEGTEGATVVEAQPVDQQPVDEQPVDEQPVDEQPVDEQPEPVEEVEGA